MSNKPVFYVHGVKERERGLKPIWTRVGAAWPHEKDRGFTIVLEALPLNFDGRLVLTEPKAETEAAASDEA